MKRRNYAYLLLLLFTTTFSVGQNQIDLLLKHSYRTLSSNYDSSIIYSDSVVFLSKSGNNKHALAEAYKNKGFAYYSKGVYPSALVNYQNSLTIAEKEKYNDVLLSVYNLYGTFYKKLNNLVSASKQFDKAYLLAVSIGDTAGIAGALNDRGLLRMMQGETDTAVSMLTRALDLYILMGNQRGEAYSLNFLAELYSDQKQFPVAIQYLERGLALRTQMQDTSNIAINLVNMGEVYLKMGDQKKALDYFLRGVVLAEKIKYADLIRHCYKMISDIYLTQRNFEQAYLYYQKNVNLKDSIFNESSTRVVTEMEAKYQTEKKQLQIDNLNKESEIQTAKLDEQAAKTRTLYIAIALFVVIIVVVVIGYRGKQKANQIIFAQKEEVEKHRDMIQMKSKEVTDSIHYAKRIQGALLASDSLLQKFLPEYFILYKPKDIVSGDFYWANVIDNKLMLITADCTGHGVPGAFMSLLNITYLNEAVAEKKISSPDRVLDHVRERIISSLNPEGAETASRDGMDAVLCVFDMKGMWMRFACSNNPLWVIRKNELIEFKPDKIPVGAHYDELKPFTLHTLGLRKGDIVYTFTDGYADQFGGEKGKKFKYRQLQELLLANHHHSMEEQKRIFEKTLSEWQGNLEQVDDILLIGIKV
ncbi:MAG: tetratricopeptide repeat protein [Bacteroidota bacterium]|nr:tetratricopeptide repeat protein [Bacteroidota bacterium]